MAQWLSMLTSHLTNVAQVRFMVSASCGLSLLLVLIPAPRVFLRVLQFSANHKTNISKFQFDLETVERSATPWIPLKFPFYFVKFSLLENAN